MSHVKNVQAFGKLTGICTGYEGQYNPGQQNLQVDALITLLNNAQQTLSEVNEVQTAYDNITNTRELAFAKIRDLGSRVISVLKSCGAHALTIQDAQLNVKKLRGTRFKGSEVPAEGAPESLKTGFIYAQDYASQAFYFAKLVHTVTAEPRYNPVEPELTVAGLNTQVGEMQHLNKAVAKAEVELTRARRKRNELFYKSEGNLFATAAAVKHYVRGAFGYSSGQRSEVSKLRFTKPID
jgi:hypothetical protein